MNVYLTALRTPSISVLREVYHLHVGGEKMSWRNKPSEVMLTRGKPGCSAEEAVDLVKARVALKL